MRIGSGYIKALLDVFLDSPLPTITLIGPIGSGL